MFGALDLDELYELMRCFGRAMLRKELPSEIQEEIARLYVDVADQIWLEEFFNAQERDAEYVH